MVGILYTQVVNDALLLVSGVFSPCFLGLVEVQLCGLPHDGCQPLGFLGENRTGFRSWASTLSRADSRATLPLPNSPPTGYSDFPASVSLCKMGNKRLLIVLTSWGSCENQATWPRRGAALGVGTPEGNQRASVCSPERHLSSFRMERWRAILSGR